MTEAEAKEMIERNAPTQHELVLLMKSAEGRWVLVIGETQSDGTFRHVDYVIEGNVVDVMLRQLASASPEERAKTEAYLDAVKRESTSAANDSTVH